MKPILPATLLVAVLGTTTGTVSAQSVRQLNVDGLQREYLLYLPTNFNPAENLPVMVWHHGGGGTSDGGLFEADFRSLANSERFIVAYAQAYPDVLEGCNCWGYEEAGGYTNGNYDIDLAYTSAMIDDLVETYNADRSRIYAGGYSMGGSYVWDLACAKSDEIAAVAPVAANCYPWTFDACDSAAPIAICHILGTNDFYAPYNAGGWTPSVAEQYDYWVAKNGAQTPPEIVSLGGGVTRYTWFAGENCEAGYQHFRRQGGGHDVPGNAPQLIWAFVSQHALENVIDCVDDSIPGDINGDDRVNGQDLAQVLANWGSISTPLADLNGDGVINGPDITIVLSSWTG